MTLETFIKDMPKVDLDLLLEGSIRSDTLRIMAEQNDIPTTFKQFKLWMDAFEHPDFQKLEPLLQTVANWLQHPDDLTRIVYELGVSLAKQNVRYAEVGFIPTLYNNMTFDQVMTAINDGRSRVERAWNVRLAWILYLPRNHIRRIDDIVRWATASSARLNGIVGIGLIGRDDLPPVEDFERPIQSARKKGVYCVVTAGDSRGSNGISSAIRHLQPVRIVSGWGAWESPEVLSMLKENSVGLVLQFSHSLAMRQVKEETQYSVTNLIRNDVHVVVGTGMPAYLDTSLTKEYLTLSTIYGLDRTDIETINLNSIRHSMLSPDEKRGLIDSFQTEFGSL